MLYKETVEPATLGLLIELMQLPELEQFRLVGGTALSLLLGHRKSIDLDLFSDGTFESEININKLAGKYPLFSYQEIKSPRLFFTYINNVKVDFVHTFEPFSLWYRYEGKHKVFINRRDHCTKIKCNCGRGAKKDFWDLYELLNHYSFDQMISFYQRRYPGNSLIMIVKSITYFAEADLQPDPYCLRKLKWEKVKKEIIKKFNIYIQDKFNGS